MHFEPNHIYHVYNRGNNKTRIFFRDRNYLYLLEKVKKEWLKYCDVLCYCLMPNHFHFMLMPNTVGCKPVILGEKTSNLQNLSKAIGKTLSSYTQAINKQNGTIGNLFTRKTKAKCLTDVPVDSVLFLPTQYMLNSFHYVHLNPFVAGLVKQLGDWAFSSWPDYYLGRLNSLCNVDKTIKLFGAPNIEAFRDIIAINEELLKVVR
jgi:putative transposase